MEIFPKKRLKHPTFHAIIVGDHCFRKEYGITDSQILGVLTGVVRDGRHIPVSDRRYQCYVHLWCDFYPIRAGILYGKYQMSRVKGKLARMVRGILRD